MYSHLWTDNIYVVTELSIFLICLRI